MSKFTIFEKILVLGSLSLTAGFTCYQVFKPDKVTKEKSADIRARLYRQGKTKMLYSTMSFFYLQAFKQQNLDSFRRLKQILDLGVPQIVLLQLSQKQYNEKYDRVLNNPKFPQAIEQLQRMLSTKQFDKLTTLTDLQLRNLEKLYLIDYCKKKKCQVIFGQRDPEEYKKFLMKREEGMRGVENIKAEDLVDNLMEQMRPKAGITLLPRTPYKVILGVVDEELQEEVARLYKTRFKQIYGHRIYQEQDMLEREKQSQEARTHPHNKPLA